MVSTVTSEKKPNIRYMLYVCTGKIETSSDIHVYRFQSIVSLFLGMVRIHVSAAGSFQSLFHASLSIQK